MIIRILTAISLAVSVASFSTASFAESLVKVPSVEAGKSGAAGETGGKAGGAGETGGKAGGAGESGGKSGGAGEGGGKSGTGG